MKDKSVYKSLIGSKSREYFKSIGLPSQDNSDLPYSQKRFSSGGQYGIEIASAQTSDTINEMLEVQDELGFKNQRFTETRGIFRLNDKQIEDMVEICKSNNRGLTLSVGPRAFYDTSASARSLQGARISYRLRGTENLVHAVEDVRRATDLGVRGILVYDEGLLSLLNRMRSDEFIPKDTVFKSSVHCGHGNPASCKLLEDNGADLINVVGDLTLPMISSIREAVDTCIDIHTDTPKSSGGFIRTYEAPDLVKVGSPIFLKSGAISSPTHAHLPSKEDIKNRVYQAFRVKETINKYYPEAIEIKTPDPTIAIPA
tara:strand:+ start:899 stop:1840 length:942 start_codon:yes stop_codon:yes gene_type:complete